MDHDDVERWIEGYLRAWRTEGTALLAELFTVDATYQATPWAEAVAGLDAIGTFWEDERAGADEVFSETHEIVAVEDDTAVVRLQVDYGDESVGRWRDLWVIRFDPGGRCRAFEEWPFAPPQPVAT
jgi:hypothetical protein